MKAYRHPLKTFRYFPLLVLFLLGATLPSAAQAYRLAGAESEVLVTGTSTLHDWEIVAEQAAGDLNLAQAGDLPAISKLRFSVVAESLKSGKESMDRNTYKALETDSHKHIVFEMGQLEDIEPIVASANRYKARITGDLTIAGTTRRVVLEGVLTLENGRAVLKGTKPLKMTDFGIEPPKALLGTIKTGDEIVIHYNTIWKP